MEIMKTWTAPTPEGEDVTYEIYDEQARNDIATLKNDVANKEASGTAETKVSNHNTDTEAHNDIRLLLTELITQVNSFLDVDDTTRDQLSELLRDIDANKTSIESITSGKVNVTDIINNLTTNVANKPLSAAQGVVLKGLIDALQTALNNHTSDSNIHITAAERTAWNAKANKATTLAGYGITDGATKEDFNGLSEEIDYQKIFVTPQMFGAVGDGVTDDTEAVQTALDNGGLIYFPAGVYKVTKQLTTTKPCKIMMFKQYPSQFWRSSSTANRYDYPNEFVNPSNFVYETDGGYDFGARIDCYPSAGEQYGFLIGDSCEVDGLFLRAMNGFTGVLLKYDGSHQYGTDNLGDAITYKSYPASVRLKHIRLDCDRHNTENTIPEAMFDFYPTSNYFYILDDIVIGQQNEFATYGFRSVIDNNAEWANSVRISNLCFNGLFDYPFYVIGNATSISSNWTIEGLTIQTYPYNYNAFETARQGHKAIITLKNMDYCLFSGCYIWDLYASKFVKLFDCENLKSISCVGCSYEFYHGTLNHPDYTGSVQEDGIETVLKARLKEVSDDANVKTLEMNTETFADGSNRISLSDEHGNTVHTDIPALSLSDEQLATGIDRWMSDNAMPTEQVGRNKFNRESSDVYNGIIESGKLSSNANMVTTNFIPVVQGDVVRWSNADFGRPSFNAYQIYLFDEDKKYLSTVSSTPSGYTIANSNVKYIRLCLTKTFVIADFANIKNCTLCITVNDTDVSFTPYEILLVGGLAQYFMLQSPNGTRYTISVNDDGTIVGKPVTT